MTTEQKAEALARECADSLRLNSLEYIHVCNAVLQKIPLVELLRVAEAAERYSPGCPEHELRNALTALRAKLPKGALE